MENNFCYGSNVLENIFTKDDFEFIQSIGKSQEELILKIKEANIKRDKILAYLNTIDSNNVIDNLNNKNFNDANSTFSSINTNIQNLTTLQSKFKEIEQDIIELIVKKESNSSFNIEEPSSEINKKISTLKDLQNSVELENSRNYVSIDNFLNSINNELIANTKSSVYKKFTSNTISEDIQDNLVLKISEKKHRVYLPYTRDEVEGYLKNYPQDYKNVDDVIKQEFLADISIYNKHPVLSRFREAFFLAKNKEMKSTLDSLKYGFDLMFKRELNPVIISAVKSQKQLDDYIHCIETNTLDCFPHFSIIFEVNPL